MCIRDSLLCVCHSSMISPFWNKSINSHEELRNIESTMASRDLFKMTESCLFLVNNYCYIFLCFTRYHCSARPRYIILTLTETYFQTFIFVSKLNFYEVSWWSSSNPYDSITTFYDKCIIFFFCSIYILIYKKS